MKKNFPISSSPLLPISPSPHLLLMIAFLCSSSLLAQDRCHYEGIQPSPETRAVTVDNFTITDTEGLVYDLYETLDSGKTVFIDLFFTRCSYCQQYAPIIEQIYQNTGAGQEDILMWGISNDPYDNNSVIDQYKSDFGITNPCAGPQGGGAAAHNTIISGQNFLGWPTYCVICPDRTMFFDPVYPPTVNGFNPYFGQCASGVGLEESENGNTTRVISMYPNPAGDELFIDIYLDNASSVTFEIFDLTGSSVRRRDVDLSFGNHTLFLDVSEFSSGYYFLKFSQNEEFKEVKKVIVK